MSEQQHEEDEVQIKAKGHLEDGVVTVTVELAEAKIVASYPNQEDGYQALDTLYAAFPTALAQVLSVIGEKIEEAARG